MHRWKFTAQHHIGPVNSIQRNAFLGAPIRLRLHLWPTWMANWQLV